MMTKIEPLPRGENPFSNAGVSRGSDGVARYLGLPASLVAMLQTHVAERPDAEAVAEFGGERATFRELWDRAARVAGGLRAAGIARGDRVALRLPAGMNWIVAFFGTLFAGATIVPVNTRLAEPEVEYVVHDSGSTFVFMPAAALPDGEPFVVDDLAPHDLAAIFYTSGTTGFPKGSTTTHEAFLTNCENMARALSLPIADGVELRTLISVPLFHVTGCNSQLLTLMYLGGSSVVLPVLDLTVLLRLLAEERISFMVTVPAVYALAIGHPAFASTDVSSVRRVGYGGAPIAPELVHRLKTAFPKARVSNGFGMTESASLLTTLPHEYAAERADSVGFACPVVDLALADADPHTGVGELLVRGANVTTCYWNKPEATEQTIVDGWLHTGDMARVEPNGLVTIVDRAKDMINRGGENVYCVEVENALAGAPGIAECAVVGVPDPVMGEKVGLVAVPVAGATIDVPAVISSLHGRLADFKIPQFVTIRDTPLPRNPGGKVIKNALRTETIWGKPLR
jgi:acyl-CoA synthetase (AMP-forming)/AMP-acid ligase II